VTITNIKWISLPRFGQVQIESTIENVGSTPAFEVEFEQQIAFCAVPIGSAIDVDIIKDFPPVIKMPSGSKAIFVRGDKHKTDTFSEGFPDETFDLIRLQQAVVAVRGWTTYKDVFGKERHTSWCYYIDSKSLKSSVDFITAPFGNEMT